MAVEHYSHIDTAQEHIGRWYQRHEARSELEEKKRDNDRIGHTEAAEHKLAERSWLEAAEGYVPVLAAVENTAKHIAPVVHGYHDMAFPAAVEQTWLSPDLELDTS